MLLTDNPVVAAKSDRYGFREHARVLSEAIAATGDLPLTVAVYGPWGAGKSSFLNFCQELFESSGVPTVRFNPWKYDQRDEVWHALIQTVLDEIRHRLERDLAASPSDRRRVQIQSALEKTKSLSKTAAWLVTRHAISLGTAGIVSAEAAPTPAGATFNSLRRLPWASPESLSRHTATTRTKRRPRSSR